MNTQTEAGSAPVAGQVEREVRPPVNAGTKPLSYRQRQMLQQAKDDWARLPVGASCTNSTLIALETRDLIETRVRYEPSRHVPGATVTVWEWRKRPNGRDNRKPGARDDLEK